MTPETLHQLYCTLTGLEVRFDMARNFQWECWLARGWNNLDLACVVALVRSEIQAGRRWRTALRFSRLIGDLSFFEECLCDARAKARVKTMPREQSATLRASGRSDQLPGNPVRTAGTIMQEHATMARLLREWRSTQ